MIRTCLSLSYHGLCCLMPVFGEIVYIQQEITEAGCESRSSSSNTEAYLGQSSSQMSGAAFSSLNFCSEKKRMPLQGFEQRSDMTWVVKKSDCFTVKRGGGSGSQETGRRWEGWRMRPLKSTSPRPITPQELWNFQFWGLTDPYKSINQSDLVRRKA